MCDKKEITVDGVKVQLFADKKAISKLPEKDKRTIAKWIFDCIKLSKKGLQSLD